MVAGQADIEKMHHMGESGKSLEEICLAKLGVFLQLNLRVFSIMCWGILDFSIFSGIVLFLDVP